MMPPVLRTVPNGADRRTIDLPRARGCALVIFGGTGDLTRRKLMPALWRLERRKCLDPCFGVLGVGRASMTDDEYRESMREAVVGSSGEPAAEEWKTFADRLQYTCADLADEGAWSNIADRLGAMGAGDPALSNHLFYLAIPPDLAPSIVEGLARAGLTAEGEGWTRLVVEKPFGHDLESARSLNSALQQTLAERQVFRIDHYLGKETVQNILAFRFGNTLFEPVWNRNYVDYVEITAAETLGVGHRAGFYEESGALRDMVANHLLQLLTLTAMEPPVAYEADAVREEKVQVLHSIPPMSPEEVAERAVRGQYGPGTVDGESVPGYRQAERVPDDSLTETFAAVEFRIENWRWSGVPFYLRTGKRLVRTLTEIAVHFKRTPQALFARADGDLAPNTIVIRFKPDEGIDVSFGAKVPGEGMMTSRVQMEFDYESAFGVELPEPYETLLLDAMEGDATLFTRGDEAEAQWAIATPILEAWETSDPPDFPNYDAGSAGPAAADQLLARNGHAWRPLALSPPDSNPQIPR